MAVIVYSTGCPKCKVLESKLKSKNIDFEEVTDIDILQQNNFLHVPVLEVDTKRYDFSDAVKIVNRYESGDFAEFVSSLESE